MAANHQGGQQPHSAIDVDALVSSIETKLQQAREDEESRRDSPPAIHRVRPSVRDEDPRAYDPKVVSLGPFHRGRPGLEAMEKLKRKFMNDLLCRTPHRSVRRYADAVQGCAERARAQYSGDVPLGANEFAEVMVLDGCFLLECLVKRGLGREGNLEGELAAANCNTTLLRNDCLLLENQIPLLVVQALLDASQIEWPLSEGQSPPTLAQLAAHFFKIRNPSGDRHLLDLFHSSLNPELSPDPPARSCRQGITHYLSKLNWVSPIFYGALYFVLMCRWPRFSSSTSTNDRSQRFPRMIPCATELREAGISIKKRHSKKDAEACFLKVSFEEGMLEIPYLSVEESTNSKFRNLVAFEQCCPGVGNYFTSYAIFMDNLINTAADVAVLRNCGVIESKLGNDEEVAQLFNTVCKGAHLNYEKHYLKDVFKGVKKYCHSSRHRWRARLMHDYFNSPWAAISVIVAFLLLLFTGLQSVYAVLAYVRPPKQ